MAPKTRLFLLLVAVLLLAGCGGGGGGGGSAAAKDQTLFNTGKTGAVTQAAKDAAETSINAAWNPQVMTGQAQALIAQMKTLPQFQAGGITVDGTVWGRYTDGSKVLFLTNDPAIDATSNAVRKAPARTPVDRSTPAEVLPSSNQAFVYNAMEPLRNSPTPTISDELKGAGYSVTYSTGSIADWQKVSNAGVVVNDSHGSVMDARYFIETSDLATSAVMSQYQSQLDSGVMQVGWLTVIDSRTATKIVYHEEKHMMLSADYLKSLPGSNSMFASGSLFFNLACEGTLSGAPSMGRMLENGCGLGLYGGWDWSVATNDSNEQAAFFFDRALGLNQVAPVDPGDPPPLSWSTVDSQMDSTEHQDGHSFPMNDSTPVTNDGVTRSAHFLFIPSTKTDAAPTTIIPAIESADQDAAANTLTLTGHFGADQGNATLDGDYLTIKSWSSTSIVADLPTVSGTLLVHAGSTSASGYLISNKFDFNLGNIKLSPSKGTVPLGGKQTFTVSAVSGSLPTNSKYRWSLAGKGSLAGGSPVTTTAPNIVYTAPKVQATDTLSVQELDPSGKVLAKVSTTILVNPSQTLQTSIQTIPFPNDPSTAGSVVAFYTFKQVNGVTKYHVTGGWNDEGGEYVVDTSVSIPVATTFDEFYAPFVSGNGPTAYTYPDAKTWTYVHFFNLGGGVVGMDIAGYWNPGGDYPTLPALAAYVTSLYQGIPITVTTQ